jgi:Neuraminidase (sialidase)
MQGVEKIKKTATLLTKNHATAHFKVTVNKHHAKRGLEVNVLALTSTNQNVKQRNLGQLLLNIIEYTYCGNSIQISSLKLAVTINWSN